MTACAAAVFTAFFTRLPYTARLAFHSFSFLSRLPPVTRVVLYFIPPPRHHRSLLTEPSLSLRE